MLYFLHGYPGQARGPFAYGLANMLNKLLQEGYPPFVFASIDGNGGDLASVIAKNTPSAHPWQARGLHVLLDEDASDPDPLIRGQAARMGGLLHKYGVPVTVHLQPGTHDWPYAIRALQYSFTFLSGNWRQAAADDTGWSLGS